MKQNRPPLRCVHCGKLFPRLHAQGLFCSLEHAATHAYKQTLNAHVLQTLGFKVEGQLFTKDGRSLTLGEVKHVGLVKALAEHAAATQAV